MELLSKAISKEDGYVFDTEFSDLKLRCKCDFITEEDGNIVINDIKTKTISFFSSDYLEKYNHQMKFYSYLMSLIYPNKKILSRLLFLNFKNTFDFSYEIIESEDVYTEFDFKLVILDFIESVNLVKSGCLVMREKNSDPELEKLLFGNNMGGQLYV